MKINTIIPFALFMILTLVHGQESAIPQENPVAQIETLWKEADSFRQQSKFDEMKATLRKILEIDPSLKSVVDSFTEVAKPDPTPEEKAQAIEIVRRQELVFRSQKAIEEGQRAEAMGDLKSAQERYRFAYSNLTKSDATQEVVGAAGQGLARVNYELSKNALSNQNWNEALKLLEEAQQTDLSNDQISSLYEKVKASSVDPKLAGQLVNPALTPKFMENLKSVDDLLTLAEQLRRTGQYDEAIATAKKVLIMDPYNKSALNLISKVNDEKGKYFKIAQEQTRDKRLLDLAEKWSIKPSKKVEGMSLDEGQQVLTKSNKFGISEKLAGIVIPDLNFRGASISDAATFLSSKSKELDKKDKRGIQIIVQEDTKRGAKEVNLSLKNVPLGEALRYVCRVADVKFKIEEFAVVIIPLSAPETVLVTRVFNVSPTFINTTTSASGDEKQTGGRRVAVATTTSEPASNAEAMNQLRERGVDFPPGSTAIYSATQGTLTVTNTQDQIDLIEELVNADSGQSLIVDVSVKIVEIGQDDLNELTNNLNFKMSDLSLTARILSLAGVGASGQDTLTNQSGVTTTTTTSTFDRSPAFNTGLRGSQGFRLNGLDSAIGGNNSVLPTPNALKFGVTGITGGELQNILSAISQKKSTDFLASPNIRVKAGSKALINNSRRMLYPIAFEKPKIPTKTSSSSGGGVSVAPAFFGPPGFVPSFPNSFEFKDIGVKLEIQPQVPADKRNVELALSPDIIDFEGFIDYGEDVYLVDTSGRRTLFSGNTINQPVFSNRKVQTRVTVQDKYTFVIGGLMRDDVQKVDDKIPFFGDLPLIGSAFRSKAVKTTKKNLMIFVTPRILLPDGSPLNPDVTPVASR